MINALLRKWIPDDTQATAPAVRERCGNTCDELSLINVGEKVVAPVVYECCGEHNVAVLTALVGCYLNDIERL